MTAIHPLGKASDGFCSSAIVRKNENRLCKTEAVCKWACDKNKGLKERAVEEKWFLGNHVLAFSVSLQNVEVHSKKMMQKLVLSKFSYVLLCCARVKLQNQTKSSNGWWVVLPYEESSGFGFVRFCFEFILYPGGFVEQWDLKKQTLQYRIWKRSVVSSNDVILPLSNGIFMKRPCFTGSRNKYFPNDVASGEYFNSLTWYMATPWQLIQFYHIVNRIINYSTRLY